MLGFLMLYPKGRRIMMFQLAGSDYRLRTPSRYGLKLGKSFLQGLRDARTCGPRSQRATRSTRRNVAVSSGALGYEVLYNSYHGTLS